jgi:hypothetical protein
MASVALPVSAATSGSTIVASAASSGVSLRCVMSHPATAPPRPSAATAMKSVRVPCAWRALEERGELERGVWLGRVIRDLGR